jgi:RHS repeat-associated protein
VRKLNFLGLAIEEIDAKGASTKYSYDKAGNLILTTTADGHTVASKLDSLYREVERVLSSGQKYTFEYDANSMRISETNITGKTCLEYDALGRLVRKTLANGKILSYMYDALGRRVSLIDTDGGVTKYGYDAGGRLIRVIDPRGAATEFSFDKAGRQSEIRYANGTKQRKEYDSQGRELKSEVTGPNAEVLVSWAVSYNALGNRVKVVEHDGTVIAYRYDPAGQLISESHTGARTKNIVYTYDPAGNRLTKTEDGTLTKYTYGPSNELLSSVTATEKTEYDYDPCGRLKTQTAGSAVTRFAWDSASRLVTLDHPDKATERYNYNADNMRIAKYIGTTLSEYVLDSSSVVAELSAGETVAAWTMAGGIWGGAISEHRRNRSVYLTFDQSSNIRLVTDDTAEIVAQYSYDAFGSECAKVGEYDTPLRYGGGVGYWSDEADRVYVRARHYSPSTGRWISRDPLGFDGGDWNVYRYVKNAAGVAVDPSGQQTCSACGPDVTAPVRAALQMTINQFWSWSDARKHGQCNQLVDVSSGGGLICWDIEQLHYWAWKLGGPYDDHSYYPTCATPSATCGNTLAINSTCWYAGSINYVVFGVMMRICNDWVMRSLTYGWNDFSISTLRDLVWLYKGRPGRTSPNYEQSLAWAESGYSYYSAAVNPSTVAPDRPHCNNSCGSWKTGSMSVHWLPLTLH